MLRGEVRLVDLDPARGSEANKRRPAVIVSNNRASASAVTSGRGVVTVVPVTSNVVRVFPFQTLLPADTTACAGTPRRWPSRSGQSPTNGSDASSVMCRPR